MLGGHDMAEPERGPRDIDTAERVGALGSAVIDAARHIAAGEHETEHGTEQRLEPGQVEALIDGWPEAPQKIARQMLEQYGPPNERRRPSSSGTAPGRGSGSS